MRAQKNHPPFSDVRCERLGGVLKHHYRKAAKARGRCTILSRRPQYAPSPKTVAFLVPNTGHGCRDGRSGPQSMDHFPLLQALSYNLRMTRGHKKAGPYRIGVRGMFAYMTTIAFSVGLIRLSLSHTNVGLVILVSSWSIGAFLFGAATGGLCGQLLTGDVEGVLWGIVLGGLATALWCGGPLFLAMQS